MPEPIFLTLEQVLVIQADQIFRYGGFPGIRDLNLLESAIMRPQTTVGGKYIYASAFDKASALAHSLILNHPFVDGNKRTGMVAALTFLELNGFKIKASQPQLVEAALGVESKKWDLKKLSQFLKKHSVKII